jgi:hypothetical protein
MRAQRSNAEMSRITLAARTELAQGCSDCQAVEARIYEMNLGKYEICWGGASPCVAVRHRIGGAPYCMSQSDIMRAALARAKEIREIPGSNFTEKQAEDLAAAEMVQNYQILNNYFCVRPRDTRVRADMAMGLPIEVF